MATLLLTAFPAHAIVDKNRQDNTTPIGEDGTWSGGDPGWDNVTIPDPSDPDLTRNFVYLGDSWVLGAVHTGVGTSHFSTGSFGVISSQSYIVQNPTDWPEELTSNSDLRLMRIKGDPGLPSLTIASQPPPLNGEVVFIGQGKGRAATETHWDSAWAVVPNGGVHHGYKIAGADVKRWGTNKIANENSLFGENDADLNGVFTLNGRDVISLVTFFSESGATDQESQSIDGNSGSAVFYKRNGQWELSGIVNAQFVLDGQGTSGSGCGNKGTLCAVFGNWTAFSDLSVYRDEIYDIINAHPEYSVIGDINLDGQVTGDGTGAWASDDVTALVDGWLYEQETASITSWKKGDMNLDGRTDLSDVLLMRNALLGSGNGAGADALASLFGGPLTVPEPSSAVLLTLAIGLLVAAKRRSRTVAC